MEKLVLHQEKIRNKEEFVKVCPFSAMELKGGEVQINGACRMCHLCAKKFPDGEVEFVRVERRSVNKEEWRGVCVYVDHVESEIHPVTLELIGKARRLADEVGEEVYALFLGSRVEKQAGELLHYPVDKVFVCDNDELKDFRIEPYTAVFESFIREWKPSVILVGATTVGRQLAPRVAARMEAGLTADCTVLEMDPSGDLSQIRPAFGGNIMANIMTPYTRPQMATVRYKVMDAPKRSHETRGEIIPLLVPSGAFESGIRIRSVEKKPRVLGIEHAEILVAAGRGVKKKEDLKLLERFAASIGGELACTRPLAEMGWMDPHRQIGLSGRTVRPKLILCFGISGAVQFAAGMKGADHIIAVNTDPDAPIFHIAHTAVVGDLYQVLPLLEKKILAAKEEKDD